MKKIFLVAFILSLTACGGNAVMDAEGGTSQGYLESQILQGESLALDGESVATKNMGLLDGISLLDGLVKVSLNIPSSRGNIAARLYLSRECLLKRDRRLVALVPGSLANGGGYYEISVPDREGFDTVRVLAKAGYCALSVDMLGTGDSFHPDAGQNISSSDQAFSISAVAKPVAMVLGIPRWDVYGETGVGTNVTMLLARRHDVRSVVVSSPFYFRFGLFSGNLFDPGFRALVSSVPYLPIDPGSLAPFFGGAYPEVFAAASAAIAGPAPQAVPTGAFIELFSIPFTFDAGAGEFVLGYPQVDAEPARADALLVQGSPDPLGSEAGTAELSDVWGSSGGGMAEVITLPGASHLMRFDSAISDGPSSAFWSPVLDFLAAH